MKDEEIFDVGERTILKMKRQPFLADDYGTIAANAGRLGVPLQVATEIDPNVDLVRKVETLTEMVQALQRRLESLEATVARLSNL